MSAAERIATAADRLERIANENGGAYQEPEAYRGSVARTMFDRPGSEDGTVTVLGSIDIQDSHGPRCVIHGLPDSLIWGRGDGQTV
jgi:hypothetical protein